MTFNFFEYDERLGKAILNGADLVLLKEFKDLLDPKRNKCKEDPSGEKHLRADREFTYIYLAIAWKSPYANYSEQERHQAALKDAELTEEEFNDPIFRTACRRFRSLQESNRYIRLLQAAELVTDKIIDYFNNVDLNEQDESGKYLIKIADVQKSMDNAAKQIETLKMIESLVKKELAEQSTIKGGATEGFTPDL